MAAKGSEEATEAQIAGITVPFQSPPRATPPIAAWLTLIAPIVLVGALFALPLHAADAVKSSEDPQSRKLAIDRKEMQKTWTDDLDSVLQRRVIRVLTVYNKTFYFTDKYTQRGLTYEIFRLFEEDLNKKLAKKHLKIQVYFVPVARDQLIPALVAGKGDIAASNLTITAAREKLVDCSSAKLYQCQRARSVGSRLTEVVEH